MRIENSARSGTLRAMRIWIFGRALFLVALLGVGCGSSDGPDKTATSTKSADKPATTGVARDPRTPTQAQPKLRTIKLWLGAEELITEIAASEKEIITGMMFRTEMAENEGMLFILPGPQRAAFWMKNTLVPLSCGYIDPDGTILEIHDMKPKDETPITAKATNILYVLEVKQGWFERHKIAVGTQLRSERGTLHQTFFQRR
jgi:uncharacterized protein